jgi:hypothetical protein
MSRKKFKQGKIYAQFSICELFDESHFEERVGVLIFSLPPSFST